MSDKALLGGRAVRLKPHTPVNFHQQAYQTNRGPDSACHPLADVAYHPIQHFIFSLGKTTEIMPSPTKSGGLPYALILGGSCLVILIGGIASGGVIPEEMGNWSPVVRAGAANRAAKSGSEALPDLLVALGSENSGMRHAATKSIGLIAKNSTDRTTEEWKNISSKLIDIVRGDKDFWTRCGAASALKVIGSEAAAPALIDTAADANPWVAAAAVEAISGMPVKFFDPEQYLATALRSLGAPRSETRSSAVKMLAAIGPDSKKAMPQVEASIATYSQDSMFADRPRIEAIVWISRYDRLKAATLANGLLMEDRWGASGRYRKLVPFLLTLGNDASPATQGLTRAAAQPKDKGSAAKARQILNRLKS